MRPIVNGLEQRCQGKIAFTYLDVDDARNRATLQGYGIRSVPSYILLSPNGQEVKRWMGSVAEEQFKIVAEKCRAQ
jgi:thioredoxin-like negative regulator of GroEL